MKRTTLFHKAFLVALFSLMSITISASKYYASPNGTGSGADYSNPCSFATGYSLINTPGDTLFLKGGQYDLSLKTNLNRIGTDVARICIFACPGETPIFDFRNEAYGQPGFSINAGASFMHIKGLVVRYAGDNGIINNGNNIIIENCEFYGNCDSGLQHKDGGNNLIKNCDSHDNFDYQSGGIATPDFGGNADGFADKQFTNTNPNTYDGCRSWRNSDDGWDLYQRIGDVIIKNSICYKNGPATYDLSTHPRLATDAAWFANFTPAKIAAYTNYGNANGFKIGGDYRPTNTTLTNCLAAENRATGFDQNNSSGSMTLYNCTSVNNVAKNFGFYDRASDNTSVQTPFTQVPVTRATLIIKNCVSLTPGAANTFTSATYLTTSNNSWNTASVTCSAADFISTDASALISPRQADGSLPNTVFMQLTAGSDLIDAGANVSLAYSGAAPDLGCYELGNLDQFPGAVTTPTNKTQTLVEGSPITSIVFTWSAGATGLSASGLPAGITTTLDNTAKTLTLSGTPSETGVFNYTISTIGGSGAPAVIAGKLVISSASAKRIAYVSLPDNAADAAILAKLQLNTEFSVTVFDATLTTNDYSTYDLLVLSPAPNSSSAGLITIEALDKPKLLLKPFQLGSTRWSWGVAANTAFNSTTVYNKTHEIFTGITFTGANSNEIQLFSSVTTNGVTGITSWTGAPAVSIIGDATGAATATNSIVEIPVGTNMNGTITNQKFLMIGVSEASTANLTPSATKLIENACYYLMGMTVPTTSINELNHNLDFNLVKNNNTLYIESEYQISLVEIFNTSGVRVACHKNQSTIDIKSLPNGLYVTYVCSPEAGCASVKFIK